MRLPWLGGTRPTLAVTTADLTEAPNRVDALSDVLRAIRVTGSLFFRIELSAPFGVSATEQEELVLNFGRGADHVLPFHMVTEGRMWCDVKGEPAAELGPGDIVVLPRGTSHSLIDSPGRLAVPVAALAERISGPPPTLRHGGDGPLSRGLCGFFRCQRKLFNPLLDALPTVMIVRRDPQRTPLISAMLERAYVELFDDRPGAAALAERLTELLFVEVVQAWLRDHGDHGWLAAIRDPQVGAALAHMHGEPAKPWTVDSLARRVGASRTALADRFRSTTGMSVMRYLTSWRMEIAAERLLATERSIAEIANDVGYQSEAALNRAFKRQVGEPPASWRRARRGGSAASAM
jgi:AraC family transcriptional regulator, alkane utilization regulator